MHLKYYCVVVVFQNDALGTGSRWLTVIIINADAEIVMWSPFFHQNICTVLQECKVLSSKGSVVGVSIDITLT